MNKADLAANLLFGSRGACFCDRCMAVAVNLDIPWRRNEFAVHWASPARLRKNLMSVPAAVADSRDPRA